MGPRGVIVRVGAAIYRFARSAIDIGSSPSSHLILPHDSVAPRHASIATEANGGYVVATTNLRAVLVNGEQTLARNVYDGDLIHVGAYRLEVLEREPVPAEEQAFLDRLAAAPRDDATRSVYADWLEERGRDVDARASPSWRRLMTAPRIERCPRACGRGWNDLDPTGDANVRRCDDCNEYVHYARSIDEARAHAHEKRRVAVDVTLARAEGDLDVEPTGFYRPRVSPPFALVLRPPDPVDLPAPIARG